MRVAKVLLALGFPIVFGAGWLLGTRNHAPAPVVQDVPATPSATSVPVAAASSCIDSAAMQANANLVVQLQDSKSRLHTAEQHASTSAAKVAEVETAGPSLLIVPKDEWSRMGKEGVLRVRTPCRSWNGSGHSQVVRPDGRTMTSHHASGAGGAARALVAGLTSEEAQTIEPIYTRVHKRTWSKIEAACRRSESFREWVAENPPETDADRINYCRIFTLGGHEERSTVVPRIAELRAARASVDRTESDAERVLLATAETAEELWNELAATLGREKAKRLVDGGALCVDENIYDVRTPSRDPS